MLQIIVFQKRFSIQTLLLLVFVTQIVIFLSLFGIVSKIGEHSMESIKKDLIITSESLSVHENEYLKSKVFNEKELADEVIGNPYFREGEYYILPHSFLDTIGRFDISQQNKCGADLGRKFDVVIIVISAVNHFMRREKIRQTWGGYSVNKGVLVLFLVAKSKDEATQKKILEENARYSDLIQASFIDSYNNLTLKTITLIKWINDYCNKAKFVFKVDDDMLVNPDNLIETCKQLNDSKIIVGQLLQKGKTQRRIGKYTIPYWAFPGDVMHDFAYGPSYLISVDSVNDLLRYSLSLPLLHLEDVFITGIVAHQANVTRIHSDLIRVIPIPVTRCSFNNSISICNYFDIDLLQLWEDAHSKECSFFQWKFAFKAVTHFLSF